MCARMFPILAATSSVTRSTPRASTSANTRTTEGRCSCCAPSRCGSPASIRRHSCSWTTLASTVSSVSGRHDSQPGSTAAPSIEPRWNSQIFPRAEMAFSVGMAFSLLRASGAAITCCSCPRACAVACPNNAPPYCAHTPMPYTDAWRTSQFLSRQHPSTVGRNASRYLEAAPPSLAYSTMSSKMHTATRRSSGAPPARRRCCTWGMSRSTKGRSRALWCLMRLHMHSPTLSRTSSSISFSSSSSSCSSSSKSSCCVLSPRSSRRSRDLSITLLSTSNTGPSSSA
mmetsp:Transcript_37852/g.119417  ORF Transcript_37852/g.119417 Transcript_37852/m.119417 type:complete len:285 (+) Transcript_37852:218-1072(+)